MPMYDVRCDECGFEFEKYMSYDDFDAMKNRTKGFIHFCAGDQGGARMGFVRALINTVPIHYKGYGFFKNDNASSHDKYARDHFDGSGTNAEMKQMDRMIQDPQSDVVKKPPKTTF